MDYIDNFLVEFEIGISFKINIYNLVILAYLKYIL